VLVCSDKVKQQSHIVDDFVARQGEQTNLALMTANELLPLASYREKLFQQLLGQDTSHNFHLPLNQLLAELNQHEGPILICIFHAERLPNKLVKELWELVLQSRFAKNKQQLNVLLMGNALWAEQSKQFLASRSKEQPIILNGNSAAANESAKANSSSNTEYAGNNKYAEYVLQDPEPKKTLRLVLISILCTVIFASVLLGMLAWLYPEKLAQITHPNLANSTPIANTVEQGTLPIQVTDLNDTIPNTMPAPENIGVPIGSEWLVTDWQTANAEYSPQLSALSSESSPELLQVPENEVSQAFNEGLKQAFNEGLKNSPIDSSKNLGSQSDTPAESYDYPVVDIPIVNNNQALKIPEDSAADTLISAGGALPDDSVNVAATADLPLEAQAVEQVTEAIQTAPTFLYDEAQLLTLNKGDRVIQLAAMSNLDLLTQYISKHNLKDVWVYKTQRFGGDWHVLSRDIRC
jgi:DamX protein